MATPQANRKASLKWQAKKIAQGLCCTCGKLPIFKNNKCKKHCLENRVRAKAWAKANADWYKKYQKAYRKRNKDKLKAYGKAYRQQQKQRGQADANRLNRCQKDSMGISANHRD